MRYDQGHKDETHRHILDIAAKQFLKNGIDGVGIATIMKQSGLTNGAFYAHFKSKDALVTEMLEEALDKRERAYLSKGAGPLDYIQAYLAPLHRDQVDCGCPIAALLSELVHHSKATRKVLTNRFELSMKHLGSFFKGSEEEKNQIAISILALMFGALQMSRAVTDKTFSDQILTNAYDTAIQLVKRNTI